MDEKLTLQIQEWLNTPTDDRNIAVGAELMLKLNRNRILYQNVMLPAQRRIITTEPLML